MNYSDVLANARECIGKYCKKVYVDLFQPQSLP